MNPEPADALRKPRTIPLFRRIQSLVDSFSYSGKLLLAGLSVVLVVSAGIILWRLNSELLTTIPAVGGEHVEGIIGTPRFINPLLAVSDADRDITELVFSGLMRAESSGELRPDLAESVEVSEDGLAYTVVIDERASFSDGTPVTAEDVAFTVLKAQDPTLKSPKRANWEGISVAVIDARTVKFTLKSPYAPFIENLTMGIIPKGRWGELSSEEFPFSGLNTEPVGAGLYQVTAVRRDASGIPTEYELRRNSEYPKDPAFIERITFRFYRSDGDLVAAYKSGAVDAIHNISPSLAQTLSTKNIQSVPLPRVFGVFFNQNQAPLFTNKEVRQALNVAAPRERIVTEVLGGFASLATGPIPPSLIAVEDTPAIPLSERIAEAQRLLEKAGWVRSEETGVYEKKKSKTSTETLAFTLSTVNVPDLRKAAELLKATWEELGASVTIAIFEQGDLSQLVIRPRKYDALLFGEVVGRGLDLFAFWHSSQRNDPGLNIALYANSTADKLLVEMRTESDGRDEKARKLVNEISKDVPAIFLYTPHFVYVFPERVKGLSLGTVTTPSERFLNVNEWYIETDRVWSVFAEGIFNRR